MSIQRQPHTHSDRHTDYRRTSSVNLGSMVSRSSDGLPSSAGRSRENRSSENCDKFSVWPEGLLMREAPPSVRERFCVVLMGIPNYWTVDMVKEGLSNAYGEHCKKNNEPDEFPAVSDWWISSGASIATVACSEVAGRCSLLRLHHIPTDSDRRILIKPFRDRTRPSNNRGDERGFRQMERRNRYEGIMSSRRDIERSYPGRAALPGLPNEEQMKNKETLFQNISDDSDAFLTVLSRKETGSTDCELSNVDDLFESLSQSFVASRIGPESGILREWIASIAHQDSFSDDDSDNNFLKKNMAKENIVSLCNLMIAQTRKNATLLESKVKTLDEQGMFTETLDEFLETVSVHGHFPQTNLDNGEETVLPVATDTAQPPVNVGRQSPYSRSKDVKLENFDFEDSWSEEHRHRQEGECHDGADKNVSRLFDSPPVTKSSRGMPSTLSDDRGYSDCSNDTALSAAQLNKREGSPVEEKYRIVDRGSNASHGYACSDGSKGQNRYVNGDDASLSRLPCSPTMSRKRLCSGVDYTLPASPSYIPAFISGSKDIGLKSPKRTFHSPPSRRLRVGDEEASTGSPNSGSARRLRDSQLNEGCTNTDTLPLNHQEMLHDLEIELQQSQADLLDLQRQSRLRSQKWACSICIFKANQLVENEAIACLNPCGHLICFSCLSDIVNQCPICNNSSTFRGSITVACEKLPASD
eukprot:TRINITY_DN120860_c0_g1_i1.p1 TRINITY_DN120860_c0_g1~~TRINITY_DN120860_c0_g1_i1.p1  ORF type:complete len:698 (+),score=61.75 TRINITY_DN120860_c0_g1_i1:172-2265(+)